MSERPIWSVFFIHALTGIIGILGQFYTLRDTVLLLLNLFSGTLDTGFYTSLIEISVLFPISFWLMFRSLGHIAFVRMSINIYAFALAVIAAAYYFAITANYQTLLASFANPTNGHIALFAIFLLPTIGAVLFATRAGSIVCGIAAIPFLATFLYGVTALSAELKRTDFSTYFANLEVPRILMLGTILLIGISLFSSYLRAESL